MRVDIPVGSKLLFGAVSYAAVEEDGTSGLVIEVFDDLDKVGAADVFLHGYLHSLCSINYDNAFVFRVCQHFSFFQDIAVY